MNNDQIPLEFLNFSIPQYPSLNTKKNFEAYFFEYFQNQEFNTSLKYLPIPVSYTHLTLPTILLV